MEIVPKPEPVEVVAPEPEKEASLVEAIQECAGRLGGEIAKALEKPDASNAEVDLSVIRKMQGLLDTLSDSASAVNASRAATRNRALSVLATPRGAYIQRLRQAVAELDFSQLLPRCIEVRLRTDLSNVDNQTLGHETYDASEIASLAVSDYENRDYPEFGSISLYLDEDDEAHVTYKVSGGSCSLCDETVQEVLAVVARSLESVPRSKEDAPGGLNTMLAGVDFGR